MHRDGEPSVEEILESIKRVMERDRAGLASAVAASTAAAGASAGTSAGAGANPPATTKVTHSAIPPLDPVDEDEADEILDLGEAGEPMDGEGDTPGQHLASGEADDEFETLTNRSAAEAMRQSLAALAMLSEPPARPQIVRQGETSLEGLVREMLRPMLAQWLDANLPEIVDRQVKAEIARIAGKKR
ncbi:DUF2497 domain-containing protein [Erythrobacter arachoides]|uniref:DUF2497 domain-containing protein n=1 Tax=Aurantiacibacter arachoides TaxID=1850444 RepID=A0A845A3Y8_9SPHN|nr:DUF2497 domain-containing protein [Aurantiacibacter arachoides]MXO94628.1 DUF2497 domain-containing protein [Aurantiacibacter arachoides]GGD61989.1 pole-organizing protein PopZ [Aurantiacibacter arachoides]